MWQLCLAAHVTPPDDLNLGTRDSRAQSFTNTHWSVVLLAVQNDPSRGRNALETLCRTYWYPLYAYLRRRGYQFQDAQDLTQEFFARLLEGSSLQAVGPDKGRFR